MRGKTLWVALGALIIAVAGVAVAIALGSGGSPSGSESGQPAPTASVTETPAPAADPTEVGELEEDQALDVIQTALAAPIASVGTSADLQELLRDVAADSYAAELEAQWQEYAANGWTVTGTPELISADVTDLDTDASPATAAVTACIDSSAVTIEDAAGEPIGDPSARAERALHLFSLAQGDDGTWRITAHSFPNDPKC
ncbi:hypothetical protein ACWGJP_03625 [Microbacterium sp. NPDC055903]